mmetsp:Transcript_2012/g.5607  ORF Transcript_2012/g.5607 Transcript_2012/m.5607 type:complete len:327 (-) Transcript_2012:30-1010(-)
MAATSSLKPKLIAGAWSAVGGAGIYQVYRHTRDFEAQTPCVVDAVKVLASSSTARAMLGSGDLSIARWARSSVVDHRHGLARAKFEVRGDSGVVHVVMGARRQAKAQEAFQESLEDEEDEEDLKGWRRYFYRPWEIKQQASAWLARRRGGGAAAPAAAEEEELAWDLDTVFFLPGGDADSPVTLLGDPASLPEYEAICLRRDAQSKSEYSRWRLRVVLGLASAGVVLAGGLRLVKSIKVSKSYGYIRRMLTTHNEVVAALGPGVRVQTSKGKFGARFIDARLRLIGGDGAVADVDVVAMRDGPRWRMQLAKMHVGGSARHLDCSKF